MFGIGMPEMILILAIALIVLGPNKLPDLAKSLGKALSEFKKATRELKDAIQMDEELQEVKSSIDDLKQDITLNTDDIADIIEASADVNSTPDGPEEKPEDGNSAATDSEGSLKDA